jgi:DNA-binding response OmpR family regulator
MNILLVEDQQRLAQALSAILEEEGYHVNAVGDGRSGLEYALSADATGTSYDVIVLDVMLPIMDGFAVARELRRKGNSVPIIMLTARDTLRDKITGLDMGADDYLTKPFQPAELLARLRALTRRSGTVRVEVITHGNTTLDLHSAELFSSKDAGAESTRTNGNTSGNGGEVSNGSEVRDETNSSGNGSEASGGNGSNGGETSGSGGSRSDNRSGNNSGGSDAKSMVTASVHLSQREFELCRLFMSNPGQTLTKAALLSRVWGLETEADENSVEAYISFLRKKLSYLESDQRIVTVRGMGYRLETVEAEQVGVAARLR